MRPLIARKVLTWEEIVARREQGIVHDVNGITDDLALLALQDALSKLQAEVTGAQHLQNRVEELESRLDKLQEAYDSAASHADRGWEYLKQAVAALYAIASPGEGPEVTGSFDEPGSAQKARDALDNLPSAGAYEGTLPWPVRVAAGR